MRPDAPAREPIFNLPPAIVAIAGLLALVHAWRETLGGAADRELLLRFAFIPARYDTAAPFGPDRGEALWTPLTYGALHGGWEHLIINLVWLVVFGSPVAWRFGGLRFVLFVLAATAAGAGAHYLAHAGDAVPMVGASAAISGLTAAAARFVFEPYGPLGAERAGADPAAFFVPAPPLLVSLANPRVRAFLIVWLAMTVVVGMGLIGPADVSIAWEAHVGGFAAGLLLFPLLDPISARQPKF
jgi:membrane associated rhomboid family serine protease